MNGDSQVEIGQDKEIDKGRGGNPTKIRHSVSHEAMKQWHVEYVSPINVNVILRGLA